MDKPIVVGLTGQTGAGKTTVASLMKNLGCITIDADLIAKEVLNKDANCKEELIEAFGKDIMLQNGLIDRKLLAKKAFSSQKNTGKLNAITHPKIVCKISDIINFYINYNKIIVIDAALLFESGIDKLCKKTITVKAPENIRINRIINRDNLSLEEACSRVKAQNNEDFYTLKSDYIIDGTLDKESLHKTILEIILKIKEDAIGNENIT